VSGKLHLRPAPPNEGVHRLACWMLGTRTRMLSEVRIDAVRRALGPVTLDRVMTGEVLPGQEIGAKLHKLTGGRVDARAFRRGTDRRWGDAPAWDARHPEFR
jgi:hypothetical protein